MPSMTRMTLFDSHLVGEGAGHDEGGMAGGTAQVEQAALRQDDHAMAVRKDEPVHLQEGEESGCCQSPG